MKFWNILIFTFLYKINVSYGIVKDKIVAIVNHDIILESEIQKNFDLHSLSSPNKNSHQKIHRTEIPPSASSYQEILNQLIINKIILQQAIQKNIDIHQYQIDQILYNIAHLNNMTIYQFQQHLLHAEVNYNTLYSQIYQEMLKKKICELTINQRAPTYISLKKINNTVQKINQIINFHKEFKMTHIILGLPIQPTLHQIHETKNLATLIINTNEINNNNLQKIIHTYYINNNYIYPMVTVKKSTQWIPWKNIPVIFDQYLVNIKKNSIIGPIILYNNIHILKIEDIRYNKNIPPTIKVRVNLLFFQEKEPNTSKIDIEKKLLIIKKRIENGDATFNTVFNEQKKEFFIQKNLNNLIWEDIDDFEPEIKQSLISLKKNNISAPIYTPYGWYLIQLLEINTLNYTAMIQERAYKYLLTHKLNKIMEEWIHELKSMSYIKIICSKNNDTQ